MLRDDIRRLQTQLEQLQGAGADIGAELEDRVERPTGDNFPAPHPDRSASDLEPEESHPKRRRNNYIQSPGHSVPSVASENSVEDNEHNLPDSLAQGPYTLEDVMLGYSQAQYLHGRFVAEYLPFIPIFESASVEELYGQSEMLFWTVMTTAALSDPTPELYLRLVDPLKRLVMNVTWINTPRSTHVVQALLVLSSWPLPNEKMLDDTSYRFVSLARSLGLQLGLHRGKFIYEFSRKQKLMPNAVKWRTRTWVNTYINEQFLSASLGLPSNMEVDYLIDQATVEPDKELQGMWALLNLAIYYSKMAKMMGSSIATPDGLLDAKMRSPTLEILRHNLDHLKTRLPLEQPVVEIAYLYVRCMLFCFSFLPDTPVEDQTPYLVEVFHVATRLVTIMRMFVGKRRITEFPVIVRQASSLSALVLFRIHVMPQFPRQYIESARQSIVTVHHLYRNVPAAWGDIQNDVTRIAKLLESLNYVLITHPYLLTSSRNILTRMRSHLTYSLFYELIWTVHESRRRNTKATKNGTATIPNVPQPLIGPEEPMHDSKHQVAPLPLFNQITADYYSTNTFTSPNGTTMTKLVPTAAPTPRGPSEGVEVAPEPVTPQGSHRSHPTQGTQGTAVLGAQGLQEAHGPMGSQAPQGPQGRPMMVNAPGGFTPIPQPVIPRSNTATNGATGEESLQLDQLLQGIDWMNHEGDDFLGWMPGQADFPF